MTIGMGDDIPTTGTITLEPHWPNVRRYCENMHRSDPVAARDMSAAMGCEAPNLPGQACPNQCGAGVDMPHAEGCPVGARERVS